jgi:hypothetical protein
MIPQEIAVAAAMRSARPELRVSPVAIPALNLASAPHRTTLLRAREMAV